MFTKKNRKIANLEAMVKNRDILIGDQQETIKVLRKIVNSLEEDLAAVREEAFKNAKKRTSRPRKSN